MLIRVWELGEVDAFIISGADEGLEPSSRLLCISKCPSMELFFNVQHMLCFPRASNESSHRINF